ncbi:glutamate receptor ionotropic, delta-2-like [Centruroides sculpturatus]|uniref:glutamate receptor ionotropic, delta-2-like n=1 Tax=Centruroides sculpturatus TaxID=218467 RepID=UPI000C6E2EEB|nr:glutamate receptor ionotropic, delta-2-like [Centruroides sculpturatus]
MRTDEFENQITSGQYFHVFNAVHQKLGFRYILAKPVDDTWNEMGVKLEKKEADMAYISLFMTYDRFSVMDFSSPLMCPSVSFIVKAPDKFPNWSSIIKPFSIQIWIVLFFVSIGFGLILHKVIEHDFIADEIKVYWPKRKIFWYLFCTFVYQGIQLNYIKRFPSRLLIGIWLLSVFVLISSYSGTLMSYMTYPIMEPVPRNFDELARAVQRGEYSCGIAPATAIWNTIKVSKSENARIFRDHIIENNNLINNEDAVKLVLQKRFAFIAVLKFLKLFFIEEKEMYKYKVSDDTLLTFVEAYPMRKKFPMKENVSIVITRLFEAGIVEKIDHSVMANVQASSQYHTLTMEDLISPLIFHKLALLFDRYERYPSFLEYHAPFHSIKRSSYISTNFLVHSSIQFVFVMNGVISDNDIVEDSDGEEHQWR